MSALPEVSVVMGVHNGAQYLRETIDSVLAQEGVSLEFIIVDDGSTDETSSILQQYVSRDSRVRVVQQLNQGLTAALINGCAAAQAPYIARQDLGDISTKDRLQSQTEVLNANVTIAFVSAWTEFRGPQWEFLYLAKGTGLAINPTSILAERETYGVIDGPTHHGSVTFRRDLYVRAGGYRREFYYGQDWDLWYRLAKLGKFQMIQQPLYRARVFPASISLSQRPAQRAIARLSLESIRRQLRNESDVEVLKAASTIRPGKSKRNKSLTKAAGLYFIGECLRRNQDHRAAMYLIQAISTYPLFVKAWARVLQLKIGSLFNS